MLDLRPGSCLLRALRLSAAITLIAPALAGCSRRPPPPTESAAPASPAAEAAAPAPLLRWAGGEPVVLVHTPDAVIARAAESGRTYTVWTGAATWVFLDAALDLVWAQGSDSLDVIDLRAGGDGGAAGPAVVHVAAGLPAAVPLAITRTTEGGSQVSVPASGCDTGRFLTLTWSDPPRLQLLDAQTPGWVEPPGSRLPGAPWLLAQLARPPGPTLPTPREFSWSGPPPAPPFAARRAKCPDDRCGRPIPFDGTGTELVVTTFDQGDCVHLGCNLHDPIKKRFATPPAPTDAASWGDLDATPPGPCGVYHFDRSGKRFLIGTSLCAVRGKCEPLGGEGVGWLSGGVDVGADG